MRWRYVTAMQPNHTREEHGSRLSFYRSYSPLPITHYSSPTLLFQVTYFVNFGAPSTILWMELEASTLTTSLCSYLAQLMDHGSCKVFAVCHGINKLYTPPRFATVYASKRCNPLSLIDDNIFFSDIVDFLLPFTCRCRA